MSEDLLDKVQSGPVTQSVGAIKNLLAYVGRSSDPLPLDVSLDNGRLVLVLSNDKKCYYVTTVSACSCPSAIYRHNGRRPNPSLRLKTPSRPSRNGPVAAMGR